MDQVNLIAWTGRSAEDFGGLDHRQASMMQATLGTPRSIAPESGDILPQLWHWAAFPPTASMDQLGEDGHPHPGDFLPPMPAKRRMWAGGSLRFHAALHVGERLTRRSVVRDIQTKGANGQMTFVTVEHLIYGERGLAVNERQDIVYLPMPERYSPPEPRALPTETVLRMGFDASEVRLFRYSALTFNAHRIHYDLAYTQTVEHYPGLVVHGPLQATMLMQAAVAHKGRMPSDFHYRGVHPVFAGPVDVVAEETEDGLALFTGQDGHQGMQATAIWEDTV